MLGYGNRHIALIFASFIFVICTSQDVSEKKDLEMNAEYQKLKNEVDSLQKMVQRYSQNLSDANRRKSILEETIAKKEEQVKAAKREVEEIKKRLEKCDIEKLEILTQLTAPHPSSQSPDDFESMDVDVMYDNVLRSPASTSSSASSSSSHTTIQSKEQVPCDGSKCGVECPSIQLSSHPSPSPSSSSSTPHTSPSPSPQPSNVQSVPSVRQNLTKIEEEHEKLIESMRKERERQLSLDYEQASNAGNGPKDITLFCSSSPHVRVTDLDRSLINDNVCMQLQIGSPDLQTRLRLYCDGRSKQIPEDW